MKTVIHDSIFGLAIADALGVPVEFKYREELAQDPVKGVRGYGTYNQPPGTWSDDSSLTFCLADSLCGGYDLADMAQKFVAWRNAEIWTPHGRVFDIGMTTHRAIGVLDEILQKNELESLRLLHYEADEYTNGNGSLMRILPLYFAIKDLPLEAQFERIWEVSALTHGHIRAALACFLYLRIYHYIVEGCDKNNSFASALTEFRSLLDQRKIAAAEQEHFARLFDPGFAALDASEIASDGYVMHSLEASIWCLLRTDTYEETVLTAINLGEDTDTTAAIVGGLAGALYGLESIPLSWREALVKWDEIEQLCDRMSDRYQT